MITATDDLWNAIKRHIENIFSRMPQPRRGIVYSVDPTTLRAKVKLMPEQTITGWLPIAMPCVGSGWGLVAVPPPGAQVLIIPTDGNNNAAVVVSAHWSNAQTPPTGYVVGQLWLHHESGAYVHLNNDGGVYAQDPSGATFYLPNNGTVVVKDQSGTVLELSNNGTVNITGNLVVSGNISDAAGAHGTVAGLRGAYNAHVHGGVTSGGSDTGATTTPIS